MSRQIGLLIAIYCGVIAAASGQSAPLPLHEGREAATDLEVSGTVRGVPPGESRFVSREFLMGLPQVAARVRQRDLGVSGREPSIAVKGIYLDVLAKELGAQGGAVAAICGDGYTSTFPGEYIRIHRPIVVLSVEETTPHDWAVQQHRFDPGPYFVTYDNFVPAFQVLKHSDRPAEPNGIIKVVFDTEEHLYGGITPRKVAGRSRSATMDGYRIAQQNCYRCHNSGEYGGTKAGVSWGKIGRIAKGRPDYFANWVRNPQAIKPKSPMPPNKDYDRATLSALQRYFATFAEEGE